jgi:hypothetical protein
MHDVRTDFRERARELGMYLEHVKQVSDRAATASELATAKSLRAAGYLLTYNLIEATARNAVTSVFDHLRTNLVSFDDLTEQLKCILLAHAKRRKPDELAADLRSIATDIVAKAFDSNCLFSGNVDARELRKTAERVGYTTNHATRVASASLRIVKDHRNDLAHGNKTFAEVGRDATVEDLRKHAADAIRYMREMIQNIESYLSQQQYLASNAS